MSGADVLRDAAITQGRLERQRQGLPEHLLDPVVIEKLAVLWEQRPVKECGEGRSDQSAA